MLGDALIEPRVHAIIVDCAWSIREIVVGAARARAGFIGPRIVGEHDALPHSEQRNAWIKDASAKIFRTHRRLRRDFATSPRPPSLSESMELSDTLDPQDAVFQQPQNVSLDRSTAVGMPDCDRN